jgi:acylphosphatase
MIARRCLVSGRVQGVFYRASAARRAGELGVRGYARNLPGGEVEVLACGSAADVQAFIDWLWIGPSAAKVVAVDVSVIELMAGDWPAAFTTA